MCWLSHAISIFFTEFNPHQTIIASLRYIIHRVIVLDLNLSGALFMLFWPNIVDITVKCKSFSLEWTENKAWMKNGWVLALLVRNIYALSKYTSIDENKSHCLPFLKNSTKQRAGHRLLSSEAYQSPLIISLPLSNPSCSYFVSCQQCCVFGSKACTSLGHMRIVLTMDSI